MAELIGMVGLSHAPFYLSAPPAGVDEPGAVFVSAVDQVRAAVTAARPDVLVIFGPDHFHQTFYDCAPPFLFGVGRVRGFGDYGSAAGDLPVDAATARTLFDGVTAAGFDPALSLDVTVDHGIAQTYELLVPARDVPLVPVVVNTSAPPLPGLRRCADLGRALAPTVRAISGDLRVLVVGSGGLSHWIPSSDPTDPAMDPDRRDFLVHGRGVARQVAPEREQRVLGLGGTTTARLAPDWDQDFLRALADGDLSAVLDLDEADLERVAGNGGHEVRTWIAAAAAWDGAVPWHRYEPVPQWLTGMGAATSLPMPPDTTDPSHHPSTHS